MPNKLELLHKIRRPLVITVVSKVENRPMKQN